MDRDETEIKGAYNLKVTGAGRKTIETIVIPDQEGRVKGRDQTAEYDQIIEFIDKLGLSTFFIRDDRIIESDSQCTNGDKEPCPGELFPAGFGIGADGSHFVLLTNGEFRKQNRDRPNE